MQMNIVNKYEIEDNNSKNLSETKYFSSKRYSIDGEKILVSDQNSFLNIVAVKGSGKVGDFIAKPFDSFFLSANDKVNVSNTLDIIVTKM